MVQQVQPVGQLVIAQTARALFDIGFEMEDGVAVFLVARAGQIGKFMHDAAPLPQCDFGQRLRLESLIQPVVAGDKAAVEQGEGEFDIIRIVAIAFLEGTDHGAGPQAEIPHGLIAATNALAKLIFHPLVGAKVEHIHVGAGEEFLAPEATYG